MTSAGELAETARLARSLVEREITGGRPGDLAGQQLAAAGLLAPDLPVEVAVEVAYELGRGGLAAAVSLFGLDPAAGDARLAAALAGAGWTCVEVGVGYARQRSVFGRPLSANAVQRHLFATAAAGLEAALALARRCAVTADPVEAACCLPVAAEAAWVAADTALQVHGGYGYTEEQPVSRMWRAIVEVRAALPAAALDDALDVAARAGPEPRREHAGDPR